MSSLQLTLLLTGFFNFSYSTNIKIIWHRFGIDNIKTAKVTYRFGGKPEPSFTAFKQRRQKSGVLGGAENECWPSH